MCNKITLLLLLLFPSLLQAQFGLDVSKYKPIPLPQTNGNRVGLSSDQRMVHYDAKTQQSDTIAYLNAANMPTSKQKVGVGYNPTSDVPSEDIAYKSEVFSALTPADQLSGFPGYPFSAVVKLYGTYANGGSFTASGILVGPRHVLTAGHCIVTAQTGQITSCVVVPVYNMGNTPYGYANVTQWWYYVDWAQNGNYNHDIGLMQLDYNIGNTVGYFGYGYNTDHNWFYANNFKILSYPAQDDNGNIVFEGGERMYAKNGAMDFSEDIYIIDNVNQGFHGESGAGAYWKDANNNRYVFAVLSHGGLMNGQFFTGHTMIAPDFFDFMQTVIPPTVSIATDNNKENLKVYPNPFTEKIEIRLPSELQGSTIDIKLYDAMGNIVLREEVEAISNCCVIASKLLANGVYLLSISSQKTVYSQTIVKY